MLSATAQRRLEKEFSILQQRPVDGVTISQDSSNLALASGTLSGPSDTSYSGGNFDFRIEFPQDYPQSPAKVSIKTPIFHPNIYSDGRVVLEILERDAWSATNSVRQVLEGVVEVLKVPDVEHAVNREAGDLYKQDNAAFEKKAKEVTRAVSK